MAKKYKAPPGLDYDPVCGEHESLSFGVLKAHSPDGETRTLAEPIYRRLYPAIAPKDRHPSSSPSAERYDIILPPGAPDHLSSVDGLSWAFHSMPGDRIRDLAAIVTLRWPQVEDPSASLPLHEAWERSRCFAVSISKELQAAVVAIQHVPVRSWGFGPPHVHLIIPCRTIRPRTGFATFIKRLTSEEEGRQFFDKAWTTFCEHEAECLTPV